MTVSLLPPSLPLRDLGTRPLFTGSSAPVCFVESFYEAPISLVPSPPPDACGA